MLWSHFSVCIVLSHKLLCLYPRAAPVLSAGVWDTIANFDALNGSLIDDNLRAVRHHPGVLAGDAAASEFVPPVPGPHTFEDDVASNPSDMPMDEDFYEADLPLHTASAACMHHFDETWSGVRLYAERCCSAPNLRAAEYASELHALQQRVTAPSREFRHSPQLLHSESLAARLEQLRSDVRQWRQAAQTEIAPTVGSAAHAPSRSFAALPVLHTIQAWLAAGRCNAPDGSLNAKQALFLVVYGLHLQAPWLHGSLKKAGGKITPCFCCPPTVPSYILLPDIFLWGLFLLGLFFSVFLLLSFFLLRQERVSAASASTHAPRADFILLGGPGTGKTHMLKEVLKLQNLFFPHSTQQCSYMNSAARLIGGRTLHTALDLPRKNHKLGQQNLVSKKEQLLSQWRDILLLCIDEISMLPADLFSACELRAQQAKNNTDALWGNMSLLLTGDFLQLPPVAAQTLAGSPDAIPSSASSAPSTAQPDQRRLNAAQGRRLWRDISRCVLLSVSHRSHGPLQHFLQLMRTGTIPSAAWDVLLRRVLQPHDTRLREPKYWSNAACVGVLRHSIRALACLHRAHQLAFLAGQRLLLCICIDSCRRGADGSLSHPGLLRYLCSVDNLTETQNLPGILFLWHGCALTLEEKVADRYGLVRGCQGELQHLVLHPDEPTFDLSPDLEPHILTYMPCSLTLQVPQATFVQSALLECGQCALFPIIRDWQHSTKADGLPFLDQTTRDMLLGSTLSITRRQFPCTNPLACTAYNLQGQTVAAMLADLSRPPGMRRAHTSVVADISLFVFCARCPYDRLRMSIG